MKTTIQFPPGVYEDLLEHLLPLNSQREEAAFVFAEPKPAREEMCFRYIEAIKLSPDDFVAQYDIFIELADEARMRIIKRAHDLKASLIEIHSHLGPWPAAFSSSDRSGFRDTVPHMWWRLNKRPYAAVVVAKSGFDALTWVENPHTPQALDRLVSGNKVYRPTNNSVKGWK